MIFTGMTRRLDDLGRVVIPKEIRRSFGIRENDALEICVDEQKKEIILRKRTPSLKGQVEALRNEILENIYECSLEKKEEFIQAFQTILNFLSDDN